MLVVARGRTGNITLVDAIETAYYDIQEGWVLEHYPRAYCVSVSHWMPLPQLPEEVLV